VLSTSKRRRQAMDLGSVDQCHKMAKGMIDLYASLLSDFFKLVPPPTDSEATVAPPVQRTSFIPPFSDSVTTCFFLTRIVMEMSECVNDINSINMASNAFEALTTLMDQTRWRFVEVICDTWNNGEYKRIIEVCMPALFLFLSFFFYFKNRPLILTQTEDAKIFYMLEDWSLDPDNREITTFLRNFHSFHKYNSRCAFKIASLGFVTETDDGKEVRSKTLFNATNLSFKFPFSFNADNAQYIARIS
jgi:exocyst complex component 2